MIEDIIGTYVLDSAGSIQASLNKYSRTFQGLLKDFPIVFKDNEFISIKWLLQKCYTEIMEKLLLED